MNLVNFIAQFPDEESCKLKYKEVRDKVGVTCYVAVIVRAIYMMAKYGGTIMKIINKILFFMETYTTIYQLRGGGKYWKLKLHNTVFCDKNTTILFATYSFLSNLFSST
jgi:hypothetical protein